MLCIMRMSTVVQMEFDGLKLSSSRGAVHLSVPFWSFLFPISEKAMKSTKKGIRDLLLY